MGTDLIVLDGDVVECLPNTQFLIRLDNGHEIRTHISGRMRKNSIKILLGDRVKVEMSPYDMSKGRIIFRHKI